MAEIVPLHLTVAVDAAAATELAPRVGVAIRDALRAASLTDRALFDEDALASTAAPAVMAEILRIRQATPAETAIARVRALHREEYGSCAACTSVFSVSWPCATIRALDGEEQP